MIKFEGIEEVEDKISGLADAEKLEAALKKACLLVEGEAKKKAPKDTGELRRSIASKIENDGENLIGVVYTPLEYAPYIEYGTGLFAENGGRSDVPWSYQDEKGEWHSTYGMKPAPYMRPALDENREAVMKIIQEGLLND